MSALHRYCRDATGLALIVLITFATGVTDAVHEVDERQEHGDNDAADNDGQEDDHDRFEQGGHGSDGVIDFFVVVIGNLQQHFRQGTGLLTDVHHANDHGGKDA